MGVDVPATTTTSPALNPPEPRTPHWLSAPLTTTGVPGASPVTLKQSGSLFPEPVRSGLSGKNGGGDLARANQVFIPAMIFNII